MGNTDSFGDWFRPIVEASGLKKKAIAAEADIDPVSFSRILNGAQGVAHDTAAKLARAINTLSGRELANENKAIQLAVGLRTMSAGAGDYGDLFKGMEDLSPERQVVARKQIRAIIDALSEEDHDTDYIDDEEEGK